VKSYNIIFLVNWIPLLQIEPQLVLNG